VDVRYGTNTHYTDVSFLFLGNIFSIDDISLCGKHVEFPHAFLNHLNRKKKGDIHILTLQQHS